MGFLREMREMNQRWATGWFVAFHRVRLLRRMRAQRARVTRDGVSGDKR